MNAIAEDRSAIALILSLCWPGLGHAVRRRWLRSLVWLLTIVVTVTVVFAQAGVEHIDSMSTLYSAFRYQLDPALQIGLLGLHGLQAIDAFALDPELSDGRANR